MIKQRVKAIISDYDGTLVPTANVKNPKTNTVPRELEGYWRKFLLRYLSA
jgi:hypothetical protein